MGSGGYRSRSTHPTVSTPQGACTLMEQQKIPAGYKQTEVGLIPEDWDVKLGSEVFIKIQDGTHFSPKTGGNDYLYVTSKNIKYGVFDLTNVEHIDEKQHEIIYKRCDVKYGDILLTKDGANTGNAAINDLEEEFSLLSSVAVLRINNKINSVQFCLQQILSGAFQKKVQDEMSGNAITRLTLDKIKKLKFFVPSKEEQTAIANALSDTDALIQSLEKLIAKNAPSKPPPCSNC
jgi:type I restriction enzyme, S subunit